MIGFSLLLIGLVPVSYSLDNGLGRNPAMGWNSWNQFGCNVSESLIKSMADAIVKSGLRDAGYVYVNIDDCWQVDRDSFGNIVPDPRQFPNGMKHLGDYLHARGLKFGIYSDAGTMTCGKRPGSLGFEELDAKVYASWGVDYLKYDNCYNYGTPIVDRYQKMRDALNSTGRSIYYSLCSWGIKDPWIWGRDIGNSWRTTDDIASNWLNVVRNVDDSINLAKYAEPGHWNDLDMLEVGIPGMLPQEYRSHFAIWAIMKSPLILGIDVRDISEADLKLLTAKEVILVNQDPLGVAGEVVYHQGAIMIIACPLIDGSRAVVLWNRHTHQDSIPSTDANSLDELQLDFSLIGYTSSTRATVRDLIAEQNLGSFTGEFSSKVLWHDVLMLKVTPLDPEERSTNWRPWNKADIS
jgi:alpha-galactosidase